MTKSYKLFIALLFLLNLTMLNLHAQVKIYGVVTSNTDKPLQGVNVLLLNKTDSVLVKGTIAASNGTFNFENINAGRYIISASFNGYTSYYSNEVIVAKEDVNIGVIKLKGEEKLLSDVTVVARKPMFEQKIDRMVINVKNSITSAGGTALEVLEKSPGVVVNRQSNSIGLNGKSGVVVMINGKISRMSSDALVQMLSGMNASNIDRIELITTPPANFDAEGNAGFINIILLSNPNKGLNGSFSSTIGYGKGYTTAGSVNFNYRNKKINLFGDYSFNWNNQEQDFRFFRSYINEGVVTDNYTVSLRHPKEGGQNARLGIDIQVTPKTVIGALVSGYNTKWQMNADNSLATSKNNIPDTNITVLNHELNQWKHIMGNINFSHTFKEGEVITADLDYLYYKDNNPNDYDNKYFNSAGTLLSEEQTRSGKLTPLSFWVGKIDYTKKLGKKVNLEAGAKLALSKFSNSVSVENGGAGNWVKDPELTADYKLKENIGALYTSLSIEASAKTSLKLGLRYEQTASNLGSNTQQNIVDRKYGRLFPSIYINQKLDDKNAVNVSYSRRITRPTFNDMAPFVIFMDPYTFFSGNSALQPAFSDIYKADYMYKSFVLSVSYTKEDGSIANFQPKLSKDNKQIYTSENLDNIKTVNISLSIPVTVTKWWTMQNNIQGNWQQINTIYKNGPFSIEQKNYSLNSSQSFTLPNKYSVELSGFYLSKYLYGAAVSKSFKMVDVGIQKKFGANNNKLRFAISDVFNGGAWRAITDIPAENIYVDYKLRFGYRTFKLTYTQSFGNKKLNANRSHNSASDEEQNRMRK
ncbi:TonB-dependent receptor family protein [Ferruginibacter lapsinanis]|uniref:outer membrane beta-barrel family protein n=1 Tax=Ferruginibacter lapsinanis TaxID=563172 RepID=UPI001E4BBD5C|nr:outer membrane beta-barrel family protein [Ferruginibacter lapsinanis]UEG51278.1 TonB-dependent receptor family protein [Ferruginibacter lapsinanis]